MTQRKRTGATTCGPKVFLPRRSTMKGKAFFLILATALIVVAAASAARLDVIRGTNGPDTLNGTPGNDLIYARGGNDIVRGRDGNDVIYGGSGNDVLRGGQGDDVIWNGAGADVAYGGPGNDVLQALANDNQRDVLDCGPGYDTAYVIEHDPVTLHGCEVVIRLSAADAASMAAANDDNN